MCVAGALGGMRQEKYLNKGAYATAKQLVNANSNAFQCINIIEKLPKKGFPAIQKKGTLGTERQHSNEGIGFEHN